MKQFSVKSNSKIQKFTKKVHGRIMQKSIDSFRKVKEESDANRVADQNKNPKKQMVLNQSMNPNSKNRSSHSIVKFFRPNKIEISPNKIDFDKKRQSKSVVEHTVDFIEPMNINFSYKCGDYLPKSELMNLMDEIVSESSLGDVSNNKTLNELLIQKLGTSKFDLISVLKLLEEERSQLTQIVSIIDFFSQKIKETMKTLEKQSIFEHDKIMPMFNKPFFKKFDTNKALSKKFDSKRLITCSTKPLLNDLNKGCEYFKVNNEYFDERASHGSCDRVMKPLTPKMNNKNINNINKIQTTSHTKLQQSVDAYQLMNMNKIKNVHHNLKKQNKSNSNIFVTEIEKRRVSSNIKDHNNALHHDERKHNQARSKDRNILKKNGQNVFTGMNPEWNPTDKTYLENKSSKIHGKNFKKTAQKNENSKQFFLMKINPMSRDELV